MCFRLPIKQGSSWTFVGPIMAMMATEEWKCPTAIPTLVNGKYSRVYPDTIPHWHNVGQRWYKKAWYLGNTLYLEQVRMIGVCLSSTCMITYIYFKFT